MKAIYENLKSYIEDHAKRNQKLKEFLESKKGAKKRPSRDVMQQLDGSNAIFLYANNVPGRVAFVRAADRYLSDIIELGSTHKNFFFVTLTPIDFVMPIEQASEFDPKKLRIWVRKRLSGFHFIGMIEAAMFSNFGRPAGEKGAMIAWHVHAIVWGTGEAALRRVTKEINAGVNALVPGCRAADCQKIAPDQVLEKLLYSLKMPQKEYRAYPMMQEVVDQRTGEIVKEATGRYRTRKRDLRPGDAAAMLTVMSEQYVDRLTFAGGDGRLVLKQIKREALRPFRDWKRRQNDPSKRRGVRIPSSPEP